MTRIVLRLALLIPIPLFALLLLVRVQPTDDSGLHDFFLPKACSAPCFMGIQPGLTTTSEAYARLAANPWVQSVDAGPTQLSDVTTSHPGLIHWMWSGKQPDWIDVSRPGMLTTTRGVVDYILIQSAVPLGAVTLALGSSHSQRIFASPKSSPGATVSYVMLYPESRLWISVASACPLDPAYELFQQPVLVEWMSQSAATSDPSDRWPLFYQSC